MAALRLMLSSVIGEMAGEVNPVYVLRGTTSGAIG